jgi:hypothetical protein
MTVSRRELMGSLAASIGLAGGVADNTRATSTVRYPGSPTISHRIVETQGLRMHVAEQGRGPLVLQCHGFPESWYSWRHQIPALADGAHHV